MGRDLATRLVSACGPVWNMYGPTETTIWSSVARIESEQVTIGRPIANTQMYVLDAHQQPVPIGVTGELWIGGEGVARGYLNRDELTAKISEQSVPHTRADIRTGDMARYLSSGQLECLGRSDDQVKVRGYRIELGRLSRAARKSPSRRVRGVAARRGGGAAAGGVCRRVGCFHRILPGVPAQAATRIHDASGFCAFDRFP